jgi:hypothetical protein
VANRTVRRSPIRPATTRRLRCGPVDLDPASVISTVALAVSTIALWFAAVRPWWTTRAAHPEVRLEEIGYQARQDWQIDQRAVIGNHGPAAMRQVTVRLIGEDGHDHTEDLWPPMPIPHIHAGQALLLPLGLLIGEAPLGMAVLSWRDRRLGTQQRTVRLGAQQRTFRVSRL